MTTPLITNQEACDSLADRLWAEQVKVEAVQETLARHVERTRQLRDTVNRLNNIKGRGSHAGRVSLRRLAAVAIAPVNMPKHRKQD